MLDGIKEESKNKVIENRTGNKTKILLLSNVHCIAIFIRAMWMIYLETFICKHIPVQTETYNFSPFD
jgi:hypothetical protein